jgi:ribonucleoside-triphosphate reductase
LSNHNPFDSYYQEYIYISRYARWLEDKNRRETWHETVTRLMTHYNKTAKFTESEYDEVFSAIYNLEVMPSMRALMSAGPALERCNIAGYNCSYLPVDSPRSFDEAMYILMCGTGVGFSVEKKYVDQLPTIAENFHICDTVIDVYDSKIGWAKAFRQLISLLYNGDIPRWTTHRVRPAGARLKTFGGRASGPEPLEDLFHFAVNMFQKAAGRQLTTLECHDLMCKIADIVVVGGVRRSAMISLSDVVDDRMRSAKSGDWWTYNGQRRLANNSAVYGSRRPGMELFMKEWFSLYESKSGERGMFSRYACQNIAARNGRRDANHEFGTNPCSEIILRPYGFCNLTEVVVRADDTVESLKKKVRIATILGSIQSSFTNFRYIRKIWKDNADEERLLGVSLTGVCDSLSLTSDLSQLSLVRDYAIEVNKEWAARLGINQSVAITCVKPSGTVSQLVNSASGMHSRFAPFYLRAVRADNKDPLTNFMKSIGIPWEADVMNAQNTVFYFPVKSPEGSIQRNDLTAVETLEMWNALQEHWCEHKPSVTINVREEEWMEVGAWMFKHFDTVSGVSFLPYDGGTYRQAPYTEITEDEYNKWMEKMPKEVDWFGLQDFEKEDTTTGSQELACTAGGCEI